MSPCDIISEQVSLPKVKFPKPVVAMSNKNNEGHFLTKTCAGDSKDVIFAIFLKKTKQLKVAKLETLLKE